MELHKLILEKENPTETEKAVVIAHYNYQLSGNDTNILVGQWTSEELEFGFQKAKKWFTENIDKI